MLEVLKLIRIYVDLRKLNVVCLHDPFPTPFTNEVLENVGGKEAYSFTDGFSSYNQIGIAPEDRHKTTFSIECESYLVHSDALWIGECPCYFLKSSGRCI
jgi:hypothetical protein